MHDGMPYCRNQGQGQGHSREVDRQSPTGLIFIIIIILDRLTRVVLENGRQTNVVVVVNSTNDKTAAGGNNSQSLVRVCGTLLHRVSLLPLRSLLSAIKRLREWF